MILSFLRIYHTVRLLQKKQILARILSRLPRSIPGKGSATKLRARKDTWTLPLVKPQSMQGPLTFRFLNKTHTIKVPADWNQPDWDALWVYNLHYFDDLNGVNANLRRDWHLALVRKWIAENDPGKGMGWDPYPTSLRIVNWIKWLMREKLVPEDIIPSLVLQTRWLRKKLEYHLLGNHLFANAKALIFAGLFFEDQEADAWLAKGFSILRKEVPEQVLPDGGHFERSPMYHAIILEDLLDLINITRAYGRKVPGAWVEAVPKMIAFLIGMLHPDGRISLFNDAAFDIAPLPEAIFRYAEQLGVAADASGSADGLHVFRDTGYIRYQKGSVVAILDVAPLGPDYQPAHGHADTLTFEMSTFNHRVVVDSGTSRYGRGQERLWQRSTDAHNTVVVDHRNSSEVWAGFRVARRAKPFDLQIFENSDETRIRCSHNGYSHLRCQPVHTREWRLKENSIRILDGISGGLPAKANIYFHPQVSVCIIGQSGTIRLADGRELKIRINRGKPAVSGATWYPEFGKEVPNLKLSVELVNGQSDIQIFW